MPTHPVLDHVQVAAPPGCEAQARRFYGGLIGLAELEKPELLRARGGVWFALAQAQLHIGVEESFAPACNPHPALRFSDKELDAIAKRLTEAGASVRWDKELPRIRRSVCWLFPHPAGWWRFPSSARLSDLHAGFD